MADDEEDREIRGEHYSLLIGLKTTVEGLLATHSNNVWSTYGGLNRLCTHVENILEHGLRVTQGDFGSQLDVWPFIRGLRMLNPVLSPAIERINRVSNTEESLSKGQVWIRDSLHEHNLSVQLVILVQNRQHLEQHYYNSAILCSREYFPAIILCLQAVELNKVELLAEISPSLLSKIRILHMRSASLPVNQVALQDMPSQRSSCEALALAPPFSSPRSKESFLTKSNEHAIPINIGSSPDEAREAAKDSLKSALRKSGSDLSPPNVPVGGFSFYDSIHSDPLMNIEFSASSEYGRNRLRRSGSEVDPLSVRQNQTVKPTIKRSQSEAVFSSEDQLHATDIIRKLTQEETVFELDDSFESESNTIDNASSLTGNKTLSKPTHKRSKSDYGRKTPITKSSAIKKQKPIFDDDIEADSGSLSNSLPTSTLVVNGNAERGLLSPVTPEGFFPKPVEGQSLLSFLSSQDFHTCANLDKENAHFNISEALIAAIEQMKWSHVISPPSEYLEGDSDEEIQELKQRIRIRRRERMHDRGRGFPTFSDGRTDTTTSLSTSPFSSTQDSSLYSDSSDSSDGVDDREIELTVTGSEQPSVEENLSEMRESGLTLSMASLYSDADLHRGISVGKQHDLSTTTDGSGAYMSAESVAISLLKKFSEKQLPKASDLVWLVSEQDAPQALLPLPNSYPISPDDSENPDQLKMTRIRGNFEWAPPRPQIIFNIHPAPKRKVLLAKQNHRCAGCGMKVEPAFMKRFRYCEYLGKYFCQCCHTNDTAYVPGRIVRKWDFTKYYVSNFSKDLLSRIFNDPLYNIGDINPSLYRRVKALDQTRELQTQLYLLNGFLQICKRADSVLSQVKKMPDHIVDEIHVYSLSDLIEIRSGEMGNRLKHLVSASILHVTDCLFCQGMGFICELCNDGKDIIFPFQLQRVSRCPDCKACYHKACYIPDKCPKCARIETRKILLASNSPDMEENRGAR